MEFERVYSGAPWEQKVGYCRALRAGNQVFITGTAPVGEDGEVVGIGDPYRQAERCLEIIQESLGKLGVGMSDIVRTRIFVTDISFWEEFGKAHRKFFENHHPTTTMVEVKQLIDPKMLIEIEADAIL